MSVALDINNRQIAAGDAVKVVTGGGQYGGVSGTVLHIFRSSVFIRSREIPDHGGVFVVRARSVSLVGEHHLQADGDRTRVSSTAPAAAAAAGARPGMPSGLPAFSRGRRGHSHPLVSETVVIKGGQYKGLLGIVKDATDTSVRVELHSQSKVVSVPISSVSIRSASGVSASTSASGYIPSYAGSQTPMIGGQTPMWSGAGSQTPMHGSMTPMHHPQTPSHESAWSANAPMTPLHSGMTPNTSVTTPSMSGAEPETPSWRNPHTPAIPGSVTYGTPYDTPATPSDPQTPHTPSTPYGGAAVVYTPEPHTPYTPVSAGYQMPNTPNPSTPTPFTPTSPMTYSATSSYAAPVMDWVQPGMDVVWQGRDGVSGRVIEVTPGGVVTLAANGSSIPNVPAMELKPVTPAKNDTLMIIAGESKGQVGTLLGVDGTDGIVKMGSHDINIIEMSSLCRYVDPNAGADN